MWQSVIVKSFNSKLQPIRPFYG